MSSAAPTRVEMTNVSFGFRLATNARAMPCLMHYPPSIRTTLVHACAVPSKQQKGKQQKGKQDKTAGSCDSLLERSIFFVLCHSSSVLR